MIRIGNLVKLIGGARNRRRAATRSRKDGRNRDLHVLNLRVNSKRSRQVRRKRALLRGLRMLLAAGGVGAVALSVKAVVDQVYYENPSYELVEMQIKTDGNLSSDTIFRASGIRQNDHLLDLDLESVRSAIMVLPQVEDVRVERRLPDIVSIEVWERVPIAWLECPAVGAIAYSPDQGWFIDATGRVFPCGELADTHLDLPVIVVDDMQPLVGKVRVKSGCVWDAVRLIELNEERLFDEQLEINHVECASDYSLTVFYRNDASVVFGTRDLEGQFDDFAAILAFMKDKGLQIATLNLMVAENKPITFYQGPTNWEEVPVLRASESQSEEENTDNDAPAIVEATETSPESGEVPQADDGKLSAQSSLARETRSGGAARGSEADVRAIMGSLYD